MPTLSSLLVQRGVASMSVVEEAISRQVLHGGDLPTNLLELGSVNEAALVEVLAECYGLVPAPSGSLPPPDAEALRVVPGDLALRHALFPLQLAERTLVAAVAEPLSPAVEEDLSFALDVNLRQIVTTMVRVREGIAAHYGLKLDRRFLRLLAKLQGRKDPSPSVAPPAAEDLASAGQLLAGIPRPASVPPPTFASGVPSPKNWQPGPLITEGTPRSGMPAQPPTVPAEVDPSTEDAFAEEPEDAAPLELVTLKNVETAADERAEVDVAPGVVDQQVATTSVASTPAETATENEAPPDEPARPLVEPHPEDDSAPPPSVADKRALAGWLLKTVAKERRAKGLSARRKGPFSREAAESELTEAESPEQVLDIFFAFTSQYFEFAALFAVHGDLAEGRDAHGTGAPRERVLGIGVPLDLPSSFADAKERGTVVLAKLTNEGLDAELAADLKGPGARSFSAAVAIVPLSVRGRTVALLVGEDEGEDVTFAGIGDLVSFTAQCSAAVERIILVRKLGPERAEAALRRQRPVVAAARRQTSTGAHALARALALPAKSASAADSSSEQLTVSPGAASVPPAGGAPVPQERAGDDSIFNHIVESRSDGVPIPDKTRPYDELVGWAPGDLAPNPDGVSPAASSTPPPAQPLTPAPRVLDADEAVLAYERTALAPPVTDGPPASFGRAAPPANREQLDTLLGAGDRHPADIQDEIRRAKELIGDILPPDGIEERDANRLTEIVDESPPLSATALVERRAAVLSEQPPSVSDRPSQRPVQYEEAALPERESDTSPPPATAAAVLPISERPIPREDERGDESPDMSALVVEEAAPTPSSMLGVVSLKRMAAEQGSGVPNELSNLLARAIQGGLAGEEALSELVRLAETQTVALLGAFPGPLRVDRYRARDQLPAASQCGPLLAALVMARRTTLAHITVRSASSDPDDRFWATHLLGEMRAPEAANAIVPRLFDDDPTVRRIARRSASSLVRAGEPGVPLLRSLEFLVANRDEPVQRRVLAIEAMAEIRIPEMIPPLLSVLGDAATDIGEAARRGLMVITRQDFGREASRWKVWWDDNARRHRIEWLIDALMHEQPGLRRAAGDELKAITKEYFGYYDDLPPRERERAQARYREWWEREGAERFFT